MDSSQSIQAVTARKRILYSVVAALSQEAGFECATNHAIDKLSQLIQAYFSELSYQAKLCAEISGRTEIILPDVLMALVEMEPDFNSLFDFPFRPLQIPIPSPSSATKQSVPKILHTGERKDLPVHIPDYFPVFPDPHSYIATPTHKQPVTEYETLREKLSVQKRDVERGLTRFMARTFSSPLSYSLFSDEHLFPLIGIKPDPVPFLSALIPKDSV